jgi:hypothetical protein
LRRIFGAMVSLLSFRTSQVYTLGVAAILALASSSAAAAAETDLLEAATAGTNVTFTVSAEGNPTPTFQWLKDGAKIPGATGVTLVIPSVTAANNGVYNALATNSAGWSLSNDLILTVGVGETKSTPSFTLQPYPTASAPAGSSITLSAQAVGTPTPVYQWLKNGNAISSATSSTLTLPSLTSSDAATYSVLAKNTVGMATSSNSVLTVVAPSSVTVAPPPAVIDPTPGAVDPTPVVVQPTPAGVAPAITMQPMNQTVTQGTNVSFKVMVSGTPAPSLQWLKDGAVITGATGASYTIMSVGSSHAGTYTVMAKNSAGRRPANQLC